MKKILIIILILITQLGFSQNPSPVIQHKYKKSWDEICKGDFKYLPYMVNLYEGYGYSEDSLLIKDTSLKGMVFTFLIGEDVDDKEKIGEFQEASYILINKGATVYQFYGDLYKSKTVLDCIKISDVIIYDGHGGFNPETNWAVFMAFKGYDGKDVVFDCNTFEDFKFKEGSTFIFSCSCFAAGESASDTIEISEEESIYRSSIRAKFLLDRGLSTYLAMNVYCGAGSYLINKYIYHYDDKKSISEDYNNGKKYFKKDVIKDDLVGIWTFESVLWKRK